MPMTTKPADDEDEHGKSEEKKAAKDAEKQAQKAGEQQEMPAYQPSLPKEDRDPDKAWQDYAVTAINGLYPNLRNGLDYAVGRRTYDGDIELLSVAEQPVIDWGKVEEAARKLAEADPYLDYKPKQSLAPAPESGASRGERTADPQSEAPRKPKPQPQTGAGPDPYFDKDGRRIKDAP